MPDADRLDKALLEMADRERQHHRAGHPRGMGTGWDADEDCGICQRIMRQLMGKATWDWSDDLGCHIPCCSREKDPNLGWSSRCGDGPLVGEQIKTGDCGQHG